eukprot:358445-Chlamydomonas_euryale.AAC.34
MQGLAPITSGTCSVLVWVWESARAGCKAVSGILAGVLVHHLPPPISAPIDHTMPNFEVLALTRHTCVPSRARACCETHTYGVHACCETHT